MTHDRKVQYLEIGLHRSLGLLGNLFDDRTKAGCGALGGVGLPRAVVFNGPRGRTGDQGLQDQGLTVSEAIKAVLRDRQRR